MNSKRAKGLKHEPVEFLQVGHEGDDSVGGRQVDGRDLLEDGQVFSAADDDERRHVRRVGRVHLDPKGMDQDVRLHFKSDPVFSCRWE